MTIILLPHICSWVNLISTLRDLFISWYSHTRRLGCGEVGERRTRENKAGRKNRGGRQRGGNWDRGVEPVFSKLRNGNVCLSEKSGIVLENIEKFRETTENVSNWDIFFSEIDLNCSVVHFCLHFIMKHYVPHRFAAPMPCGAGSSILSDIGIKLWLRTP